MTQLATQESFGTLIEPATLRIQRMLPGPIERVWTYLVDGDLRKEWLADGEMEMRVGAPFEFVWHNDQLKCPHGERPETASEEHRLQSEITEVVPLRKISFAWAGTGGVTFELEPKGKDVLFTVTHHRVEQRSTLVGVSTGWHAHVDVLVALLKGVEAPSFWDNFTALKKEYETRTPA